MMSIQDSKEGVNINSVRFFKAESLLHVDETWDRIKVVCTQPYNKCVQYGLSFVTVHSSTENKVEATNHSSSSSQKLGNFVLKEDSESSSISLGNWFSKRKSISPPKEHIKVPKTSLASSIKEDSNPRVVKPAKLKKTKINDDNISGKIVVKASDTIGHARRASGGPLLYVPDEDDSNDSKDVDMNDNKNKNVKDNLNDSHKKKNYKGQEKKKDSVKKEDTSNKKGVENKRPKDTKAGNQQTSTKHTTASPSPKYQTKPFNKLLNGVTFVISGFENPLRSDLRNQALEMGAFYKSNWDRTCTHLICAFPNTPKCRSVQKLNGKIVTKDWIADCYNQCKRLPWRRYALLQSDQNQSESEEEIHEEKKTKVTPNVHKLLGSPSTSHDVASSSASIQPLSPSTQLSYPSDDNTDIDEDSEFCAKLTFRCFSNIFQGLRFFVHASIGEPMQSKLFRYITTYGGYCFCDGLKKHSPIVNDSPGGAFHYIFADKLHLYSEKLKKMKDTNSKVVRSDWIWECINREKLVPDDEFIISCVDE